MDFPGDLGEFSRISLDSGAEDFQRLYSALQKFYKISCTEEGRLELTSVENAVVLSAVLLRCSELMLEARAGDSADMMLAIYTSICRLSANLCTSLNIQEVMSTEHMLAAFQANVKYLIETVSANEPQTVAKLALRATVQLLCNAVVNNDDNQDILWRIFFPATFRSLLAVSDADIFALSCSLLYNCICRSDTRLKVLAKSDGKEILKAMYTAESQTKPKDGETVTRSYQWVYFVTVRLLQEPYFLWDEFCALQDDTDGGTLPRCLLLDAVEHYTDKLESGFEESLDRTRLLAICRSSCSLIQYLKHELSAPVGSEQDMSTPALKDQSHPQAPLNNQSIFEMTAGTVRVISNVTFLALALISSDGSPQSLSNGTESRETAPFDTKVGVVNSFLDSGLVDVLLGCFKWAGQYKSENTTTAITNFKCDLMRLVANCSYGHTRFQTAFGEGGGMECVMNETRLEEKNPYLKEWAIFVLRNLTENHERNQQRIADLKAQGVLSISPCT